MKNLLFYSTILILGLLISACNTVKPAGITLNKFDKKYIDYLDEGSIHLYGGYNFMVEQSKEGKIIEKTFYPSTNQMTQYASYAAKDLKKKDGPFIDWYDNGRKWKEGMYVNNERVGEWKYYFFGADQISQQGNYENGQQVGLWITMDTLGRKRSAYHYLDGKRDGEFKHWDEEGNLTKEGKFSKGELISETNVGEKFSYKDGKVLKLVEKMPEFKGCEHITDKKERKSCSDNLMLQHIYKNIRYPADAREYGIEGMAIIRFIVEKDGSISNIQTLRGICESIKTECESIVRSFPDWHGGETDGKPVRVQFNLPVKFKLE